MEIWDFFHLLNDFIYFLIEFIGWYWLIKLYRFQVYSSIKYHLYIIFCVHHPRSIPYHHHLFPLYPLLNQWNNLHLRLCLIVIWSMYFLVSPMYMNSEDWSCYLLRLCVPYSLLLLGHYGTESQQICFITTGISF